jgi:hypothetical protein
MPAYGTLAPAVRAQTDQVTPQDQATFPGAPPGFTEIAFYNFADLFNTATDTAVQTIDITFGIPFQITNEEWVAYINTMQAAFRAAGYDLLAYEVDEQPTTQLEVPTEIDIPGLPPIPVPQNFCVPLPSPFSPICAQLGGAPVINGFNYRLWLLVTTTFPPSPLVRAQGLLLFFEVPLGILAVNWIYGLFTHQTTVQEIQQQVKDFVTGFLQAIGSIPLQTIEAAEWPLIALGAVAILAGVAIPAINASGGFTAPGGAGAQGSFGLGGAAPRGR